MVGPTDELDAMKVGTLANRTVLDVTDLSKEPKSISTTE